MNAHGIAGSANSGKIKKLAGKAFGASKHVGAGAALLLSLLFPWSTASATAPQGVWLVDGKVAVQIYDCNGLLCGRLRWLDTPREPGGELKRDKHNPDPALRERQLCGLTLLWDLRPTGPDRWEGGWFYDPTTGRTYNVATEHTSSDQLVARFYEGFTVLGATKTLNRTRPATSEGWC